MSLSTTQIAQLRVLLADMMGSTVAVETYSGDSAYGPIYAASANVTCDVDATRRLVRNSNGDEVISELTLRVNAADDAKFTPESRVTVSSRVSTVLAVSPQDYKGTIAYVEVACS